MMNIFGLTSEKSQTFDRLHFQDHTASGRWFIWMNYTVHAFMYTYYALRAMRKRLPKMAAMMVTILQILQMVGGVFIG